MNLVRPRDLRVKDLAARPQAASSTGPRSAPTWSPPASTCRDELVDGLLDEARDHAVRRALEDAQRKLVKAARRPDLRAAPAGRRASTSAASTSWPAASATRGWHDPGSSAESARWSPAATTAPALDVDALLDDPRTGIIVCCGSGGVGKTTTSAALALRAAERGRKVVVLTIDPARRLAQSMGIEALDNTPRPVAGASAATGSLDAMMLDMKRTFDEVVESAGHAGEGEADPREPLLHRAVVVVRRARRSTWRWRSSASSSATPARPAPTT